MNILICSILRNEAKYLDRWHKQIKEMCTKFTDINFFLSIYENDSNDGSYEKVLGYDWDFVKAKMFITAKLNLPYFIGGKSPDRTSLLAYCRNTAMFSFAFLQNMDYVLFVEPDTEYTLETVEKILYHEKFYGKKLDVFCGKSVHPNSDHLYDSWGTRKTDSQLDWKEEDGQNGGFEPMWSAFNCLVLYNAEPIKRGIAFGGINQRLNIPDCDTVVICENFRKHGYDKIYWDTNLKVTHFCE